MNKTKLILGALSVVIIGAGTFTVSALQSQPAPASASQSTQTTSLVKPTISEKAVTDTPQNTSDDTTPPATVKPDPVPAPKTHTIPASIGLYGTPLPAVEAYTPDNNHRTDGFDNMCYIMDDGSYTTVIYQGAGGDNMYPYLGEIDVATGAPATATGSQQWCAEHDPHKAAL